MKARPSIYSRPAGKPLYVSVPKRDWDAVVVVPVAIPAPIVVDRGSECHVTPHDVAARMVEALGCLDGAHVLEPSAGTGNLARAVLGAGYTLASLTMVEMHHRLADVLRAANLGHVEHTDFLDYAPSARRFDAILINPPFSRVRPHMAAARSLLSPGGVLVGLVPIMFEADGFDTIETLPRDTFATANVSTKLVYFGA
jgi:protein-L-isoaspartate O-methyltransferase